MKKIEEINKAEAEQAENVTPTLKPKKRLGFLSKDKIASVRTHLFSQDMTGVSMDAAQLH